MQPLRYEKHDFFFRRQHSSKRKYSLKEGNLALARLDERTDDGRECSSEREREDTTELGNGIDNGVLEEVDEQVKLDRDDKSTQEEVEDDNYFQDLTDLGKYFWWEKHVSIHLFPSLSSLSQCQSLTQYPLRGSQGM